MSLACGLITKNKSAVRVEIHYTQNNFNLRSCYFMHKTLSLFLFSFFILFSSQIKAADKPEKRYSVAFAPYFQDEYDDIGPFAQNYFGKESDKYQYQFNIMRNSDFNGFLDEAESSEDYYSIRRLKFKIAYENDYPGASVMEGTAFIYGRRYYLYSENRRGFAYGWYAGLFLADEEFLDLNSDRTSYQWASLADSTGIEEVVQPVASLEIFYKWYPYKGLFIEPGVLIGADTGGDKIEPAVLGQLIIGYEF